MHESYLCIDAIQTILDFSDIKMQLILTSLSHECYDRLIIKKLKDMRLTQEILKQKKFSKLQILYAYANRNITDVNHLKDTQES